MTTEEKYLYCPKCKEYPDNILEDMPKRSGMRFWDGDCYVQDNEEYYTGEESEFYCVKCNSVLVDDTDAKICDICKSPEDDDGRCGCTNQKHF